MKRGGFGDSPTSEKVIQFSVVITKIPHRSGSPMKQVQLRHCNKITAPALSFSALQNCTGDTEWKAFNF